jgi:hypothetical protein
MDGKTHDLYSYIKLVLTDVTSNVQNHAITTTFK